MIDALEIWLAGYCLEIYNASYLVQVTTERHKRSANTELRNVPDWVFHSKHAIWLTDEDASMLDRANHGDGIKKQLQPAYERLLVQPGSAS